MSNRGLRIERDNVDCSVCGMSKNVVASLHKYQEFVCWLLDCNLGAASFVTVMEMISGCENDDDRYDDHCQRLEARSRGNNVVESYSDFFSEFSIEEGRLLSYGLSKCIFASVENVLLYWRRLREDLLNDHPVYIRSDPHGIWREFYRQTFKNSHVYTDRDGNTVPVKVLSEATNYTTRPDSFPRCVVLKNYVLSHVFDFRTMNPLLFSNPCNFAYTPTLFDPFTGKASGQFAERFRRAFKKTALEKYGQVFSEYVEFVNEHDVLSKIREFTFGAASEKQLRDFRRNAKKNWSVEFVCE